MRDSTVRTSMALLLYEVIALVAAAAFRLAALAGVRREELNERLVRDGDPARETGRPHVWVHAASVGEVAVAHVLLAPLRALFPGCRFLLTCQTASGKSAGARSGFDEVRYLPLDTRAILRRFLEQTAPRLYVGVETELWPRLFVELARSGIPRVLVNARLSARSFARYRHVTTVFRPGMHQLNRVCARDDESLQRLLALGAPPERSVLCGDLKLDAIAAGAPAHPIERESHLLLALSTHEGEERVVLEAYEEVRRLQPETRLVLIPRHPVRCDAVESLARNVGAVVRWSEGSASDDWRILLVDTTGEARRYLARATACFVGGSLVAVGGHNLAEPAAAGIAFASGPHLDGVRHQARLLEKAGALHIVRDANDLATIWRRWIEHPSTATAAAEKARSAFAAAAGALERTMAEIEAVLRETRRGGRA